MYLLPLLLTILSHSSAQPLNPGWELFTPPDSSFHVMLPARPHVSIIPAVMPHSMVVTHAAHATGPHDRAYTVAWTDYDGGDATPAPTTVLFQRARDALLRNKGGRTVVVDRPDTVGGYPGWRTIVETRDSRLITARFLITPAHFYQLTAETQDTPAGRAAADRFVRSFVVTGRTAT